MIKIILVGLFTISLFANSNLLENMSTKDILNSMINSTQTPQKIDDVTTLLDIHKENGKDLVYITMLDTKDEKIKNYLRGESLINFFSYVDKSTAKKLCNEKYILYMMENRDISLIYKYVDEQKNLIHKGVHNKVSCKNFN